MGEQEKRYIKGYDFYFWEYEEQTKIKHQVLKEYIDKWIKIVGSYSKLNYFDCFGGCGAYIEKNKIYYGSPVITGKIIDQNNLKLNRQVNLIIIDLEKENTDNIKKIFEFNKIKVKPYIINNDFDNEINKILDTGTLAPTFFFIDPFGFRIKYSTLQRIMKNPKSEVLLNFMFNSINRFLIDSLENTLNDLFGTDKWKQAKSLSGKKRENLLKDIFENNLRNIANFVYSYRINFPNIDRTYYYLIHLTNHRKGCSIFKSCFANINNGNIEFKGKKKNEMTFFDIRDVKLDEIKNCLLNRYIGQDLTYFNIIDDIIDKTIYLEKDIRESLKQLEKNEYIYITRITSKKTGIDGEDIIHFSQGSLL